MGVAGIKQAHSGEFCDDPEGMVFVKLKELAGVDTLGHNMRLGDFSCLLKKGTLAAAAYGQEIVLERHRHRYEFSPEFEGVLERHGMVVSGKNPQRNLVEIIELPDHPWFLGCQFHPEFKSRPLIPHPLFVSFVGAAVKRKKALENV